MTQREIISHTLWDPSTLNTFKGNEYVDSFTTDPNAFMQYFSRLEHPTETDIQHANSVLMFKWKELNKTSIDVFMKKYGQEVGMNTILGHAHPYSMITMLSTLSEKFGNTDEEGSYNKKVAYTMALAMMFDMDEQQEVTERYEEQVRKMIKENREWSGAVDLVEEVSFVNRGVVAQRKLAEDIYKKTVKDNHQREAMVYNKFK